MAVIFAFTSYSSRDLSPPARINLLMEAVVAMRAETCTWLCRLVYLTRYEITR